MIDVDPNYIESFRLLCVEESAKEIVELLQSEISLLRMGGGPRIL